MTNENKTGTARKPVANIENNETTNKGNSTMTNKETSRTAEFTADQANQIKISVNAVAVAGETYVKGVATLARTYKAAILQEMEAMTKAGLTNRQAYRALLDVIKCSQAHLSKTCIDNGFPPCEEKAKDKGMQDIIRAVDGISAGTSGHVFGKIAAVAKVDTDEPWVKIAKGFSKLDEAGQAKAMEAIQAHLATK